MAVVSAHDASRLGPGEFFGYGVDSGTGCFMDAAAGPLLETRMGTDSMTIVDEMQENHREDQRMRLNHRAPLRACSRCSKIDTALCRNAAGSSAENTQN